MNQADSLDIAGQLVFKLRARKFSMMCDYSFSIGTDWRFIALKSFLHKLGK